ncbi:tryptophan-rich possible sensory protein, TSPO homolog [Lachnospiraceae bacterium KM106-2]|nr:tryptophan-rich possible sensory protein, TSPO homolog [Lachnospiraceae bacterium KM106-2]
MTYLFFRKPFFCKLKNQFPKETGYNKAICRSIAPNMYNCSIILSSLVFYTGKFSNQSRVLTLIFDKCIRLFSIANGVLSVKANERARLELFIRTRIIAFLSFILHIMILAQNIKGEDMNAMQKRFQLVLSFFPAFFIWFLTLIMNYSDIRYLFSRLDLPALMPGRFLYIFLWLIIYLVLGAATYNMLDSRAFEDQKRNALLLYYGGILLNFLWPFVFWQMRRYGLAFIILILLDLSIAPCIISYHRIRSIAGTLMIIAGVWYLFLTYWNFAIILLN